jgi:chitin-binding protein
MINRNYLFGMALLGCSQHLMAHGLIENPPSRNWICGAVTKPNQVNDGTAQHPICKDAFAIDPIAGYNFMAVVTHTLGRSVLTPLPKNVCGFDGETWKGGPTPWDVPMQWPATPMIPGPQTFTWNITWGPHFDDTMEFRYWITKADFAFSPTKALGWDDFETEPFCIQAYDDKKPDANPNVTSDKPKSQFMTKCTVPARKGHHVFYGEWGRTSPTFERFHGCVDASFGGTGIGPETGAGAKAATTPRLGKKPTNVLGRTVPRSTARKSPLFVK